MNITHEIDVTPEQHQAIEQLRNSAFADFQVARSYYKQLPHMRVLSYSSNESQDNELYGYMGLDYRVIKVAGEVFKVLGVIDLCVANQGQGLGTQMMTELAEYAQNKDVDFIILMSDLDAFYSKLGYQRVASMQSWLRIHEHTNLGVAVEHIDELYVKPVGNKTWPAGHMDWLGYMF